MAQLKCGHITRQMSPQKYAVWFVKQDIALSCIKKPFTEQFICNVCFSLLMATLLAAKQHSIIGLMYYRFGACHANINYFIWRNSSLWKVCWAELFRNAQ
eukprot:229975_1